MSGLIHLYYGNGKGKTTAAYGMALRAIAAGYGVMAVRFCKGSLSGEAEKLKELGALVYSCKEDERFIKELSDKEKDKLRINQDRIIEEVFEKEKESSDKGVRSFIILDELTQAFSKDLLDKEKTRKYLENKESETEIVITGRDPEEWMMDISDYITEFKCIRHPYDKGIGARIGIEY
ncbi:MAG: cob(I)yrinic acid a,c-diamide adenosyltransferase [Lachnospiraceae bacterium]|nr:cob(I)yrinic acid a,c-diamide adenosyltransferase [Lachnospiraceae bacterium]